MSKKRLDDDDDFYEEDWSEPTNTGSITTYTEYNVENPDRGYQGTKIGYVTDDTPPTPDKPKRRKRARAGAAGS